MSNNIFDLISDCMEKLDRDINHRICKMLPSKMNAEIPATTTYLQVANWSYAEHALAYRMISKTYIPYAGDVSILLHKYGMLTYTPTCELTKLYIQERTRKGSAKGKKSNYMLHFNDTIRMLKHKFEGRHQLLLWDPIQRFCS